MGNYQGFKGCYVVGTKEFLKIRIEADLKKEFKRVAEDNNSNMTELILKYVESYCDHNKFICDHKEIIENRCIATDKKLMEIKERMIAKGIAEQQAQQNKKNWYSIKKPK